MSDNEPSDNHIYEFVMFRVDSLKLMITALKFCEKQLESALASLRKDKEWDEILDEARWNTIPSSQELGRIKRVIDWLENLVKDRNQPYDSVHTGISHGAARYMKTALTVYVEHFKLKRDALARNSSVPSSVIETIDARLAELREMTNLGIFQQASLIPLIAGQERVVDRVIGIKDVPEATLPQPLPVSVISTVQILDKQLQDRCLDLFQNFTEQNQGHRYDTIITEATRVLEDRMRTASSAGADVEGVTLAAYCFSGDNPRLKFSDDKGLQEGIHLFFRGVFSLIRNPVHHKLNEKLEKERVIQILGLIDYALHLIGSSIPRT